MLKSIATACTECTATSLVMIEKRSKRRLKKEIIIKNIVVTEN